MYLQQQIVSSSARERLDENIRTLRTQVELKASEDMHSTSEGEIIK